MNWWGTRRIAISGASKGAVSFQVARYTFKWAKGWLRTSGSRFNMFARMAPQVRF